MKIAFAFIAFFRPAILHPSLPSTLIILPLVFAPFLLSPREFVRPIARLGLAGLALAFVLLWSLTIDIFIHGLSTMQLRSQFATAIRFVLYVYIAYFIVNFLVTSRTELRRTILWAVGIQCMIAVAMLADQRVKFFFFQVLSGYTGTEKVFREYFLGVRIFGWSEELFYTAPVMMLSAVVLFFHSTYLKWLFVTTFVAIIAALNARISALATLLLLSKGRGLATVAVLLLTIALGGSAIAILFEGASRVSDISNYIFSDFQGGRSRTVEILLGHVRFPERAFDWVFGSHVYLYGEAAAVISDVGFTNILMFGGILYLGAWTFILGRIIIGCSSSLFLRAMIAVVFVGLGMKGLIFSGNAMTLLILVLYFDRRRYSENVASEPSS